MFIGGKHLQEYEEVVRSSRIPEFFYAKLGGTLNLRKKRSD